MTTTTADADGGTRRSKLNFLSLLCLCLATAFLTASVFLILQYKQGIPFAFGTSVALAAAAALIVPIIAAVVFRRYVQRFSYPGMTGFMVANLVIAVGTGLFIF